MSNTLTSKVSGRMSSRGWAIALGIGAVALAAILLVVYLDRYRARVGGENAPTPVLEAKQAHPGRNAGYARRQPVHVHVDDAPAEGSRGRGHRRPRVPQRSRCRHRHLPRAAAHRDSFAASDTASVDSQITGTERAISISIDSVHGSLSQVMAGDSVDIYVSVVGVVKLFRPNVKVLTMPSQPGPAGGWQPGAADADGRGNAVRVRRRQRAVLLRSPTRRRREAHEAVAGQRVDGAEVDKDL